jgi:hypothetical protein
LSIFVNTQIGFHPSAKASRADRVPELRQAF